MIAWTEIDVATGALVATIHRSSETPPPDREGVIFIQGEWDTLRHRWNGSAVVPFVAPMIEGDHGE